MYKFDMQLAVNAGLPLLPLLGGQLGTIDTLSSRSSALYVPSKLDAELLKEAQSSLVDLSHFDRECSDRCHLRHTALLLTPARVYLAKSRSMLSTFWGDLAMRCSSKVVLSSHTSPDC